MARRRKPESADEAAQRLNGALDELLAREMNPRVRRWLERLKAGDRGRPAPAPTEAPPPRGG